MSTRHETKLRDLIDPVTRDALWEITREQEKIRVEETRRLWERGADERKSGPLKVYMDESRKVPGIKKKKHRKQGFKIRPKE